ncbi:MAG: DnaJ domain-containing protein [Myxococcota bacterium]
MAEQVESELSEVERIKIERAYERLKKLTYYEILNLPNTADKSQIKRNYYAVSKEYHPDRYFRRQLGSYKDKLEGIFDLITRAYNTLNDDSLRAAYDRNLIEESQRKRPVEHEISIEAVLGSKAQPPKPSAPPSQGAPTSPAGVNPLFLDKFQQQLAGRVLKGREYLKLGKEAFDNGRLAQAVSHLQLASSFDASNPEIRLLLEQANGRYGEVRADQLFQRGLQEEAIGNTEGARQQYKQAVDCKPKKAQYYHKLGKMQLDVADERRAGMENLKQAVVLEPRNLEFLLSLAAAYEQVGMPRNALREYEKVISLEKNHDTALRALKRLKAAL